MADLKISQLTGANTPLAGTEEIPLVQSGSTKKVSVANLTAGRNISAAKGLFGGATASGAACEVVAGSSSVSQGYLIADSSGNSQLRFLINGAYSGGMYTVGSGVVIANNGVAGQNINVSVDGGGSNAWVFNTVSNLSPTVAGKGINFTANTNAPGMTSQLLNWYEEGTWTPDQGAGLTVVGAFSSSGTYTRVGRQVTVRGAVNGATSVAIASTASQICTNLPFSCNGGHSGSMFNAALSQTGGIAASAGIVYAVSTMAATASITFTITYQV